MVCAVQFVFYRPEAKEVKSESEVVQSCPTLCNPMDSSVRGSSIHGIFQARVLEWGAIAFSKRLNTSYSTWQMAELEFILNLSE